MMGGMRSTRESERHLRLLSFDVPAGAHTNAYREYFTRGWQTVLPHRGKGENLAQVATLARAFDVVALQEADSHSVRSGFRHQVQVLAGTPTSPTGATSATVRWRSPNPATACSRVSHRAASSTIACPVPFPGAARSRCVSAKRRRRCACSSCTWR